MMSRLCCVVCHALGQGCAHLSLSLSLFICLSFRGEDCGAVDPLPHPIRNLWLSSLIVTTTTSPESTNAQTRGGVPVTFTSLIRTIGPETAATQLIPGVADSALCIIFGRPSSQQSSPAARSGPSLAPG